MMSTKIKKIAEALIEVGNKHNCAVAHYFRAVKDVPMIIWAEDGEGQSLHSDNLKEHQLVEGSVDFFTKTEFDPIVDAIQDALNPVCAFTLNSVQYEEETGLIHYEWIWHVI